MAQKILILHDYFLYKGGGERLVISLAKNLGADVATAFIAKDAFDPRTEGIKTIELYKEKAWSRVPGFRYLQVQLSFLFKTKFVKNYDVVIYSGDCLVAMVRTRRATRPHPPLPRPSGELAPEERIHRNIAYMHSPPRHLYDLYEERLRSYPLWKKILFVPFAWFNRARFEFFAKRLDLIVTNSKNTQARIKKYLGLESVVVYPPCDTLPFRNLLNDKSDRDSSSSATRGLARNDSGGDYFFSWARLYDVKRVPMIVEAFTKMPDQKLVVASGGPDLEKCQQLAAGHPNITILGWISDDQLIEYLGKCLATIYIPIQEDFGMTAVESMQAGKPVIGVAEGGLLEIIEDKKNGLLLPSNFTIEDLRLKILELTPERSRTMESACYETAKKFSEEEFVRGMKKVIEAPRVA